LKETRPLWPPQRGVGLREPNLGKTNPRVTFLFACDLFCALSRGLVSLLLTLTRLVVVIIFVNFSFALFTPPSRRLSTGANRTPGTGLGSLCVGSGPLIAGSRDSGTKDTQALIKARRGSGADTCPDHTVFASAPRSGGDPMLPRGLLPVT
jgi:hypothetical protein